MYRYFGDVYMYDYINGIAYYVLVVSSIFYFIPKRKVQGAFTKYAVQLASHKNVNFGKLIEFVFVSIESYLLARMISYSTYANRTFGDMVGTGANYFATLIIAPFLMSAISFVLLSNPLKQIDIATLFMPVYLCVVKMACYSAGCCWGISWEHGPYNHLPDHQGNQVPVQAIESFFALAIFFFLLWYRKKAKTGTVYPMYVILYCVTRFPIEFLSGAHEPIWGRLNTYHFLCIAGFVVGLVLFFIIRKVGEKLSRLFDKPQKTFDRLIEKDKEKQLKEIEEEKAMIEAERLARLEKAKLARAKAKARKK
ncbi:MAG: prolipoprotein diacylglyceryl transferase [Clostridia bacterium]|nr:prolipoprotein diacylglyceryl transferase [Clostridia bacterium]